MIAPGETAYCQIKVSPPLVAMREDRFILRDETAQRTIGGGVVTYAAAGQQYIAVVSGSPSNYWVDRNQGAPTIFVFSLP